ncbi:DUF6912 family protein [Brevibacterium ihuae]|uniref:DUF6912 family protein n=1 Tax=Brevibacterium ihuae TaxID=1631743 RepID=UPI000C78F9E6|nr:hypothetical protein [Brevibacterium ihuae]
MNAAGSVRAYVPLTHRSLAAAWPHVSGALGFAPDERARRLRGEELEEAEWIAMAAAAEVVVDAAVGERCARVVLACDLPADLRSRPVSAGVTALGPSALDPARVVSAHIDDPAVVAALPEDPAAAAAALRDSALLWYDVSEIDELIEALGQE